MTKGIIKWAVLSDSDKARAQYLGRVLTDFGISIFAGRRTSKTLNEVNIPVHTVSSYTGASVIMSGRLEALHPKIQGGISGNETEADVMRAARIHPISLVIVNFDFPFREILKNGGHEIAIKNMDVGHLAMILSASSNYERVTVIVDPNDCEEVLAEMKTGTLGPVTSIQTRRRLAGKALSVVAGYSGALALHLKDDYSAQ